MVEIVGDDPQIKKRVTCRECGAILEYTPIETISAKHTDYSGSTETWHYVECPRCSNKQEV